MKTVVVQVLAIICLSALVNCYGDYHLKCTAEEMGIRWPSYFNYGEYFVCGSIGGEKLAFNCKPGKLFTFELQKCTLEENFIPPTSIRMLPTSSPRLERQPKSIFDSFVFNSFFDQDEFYNRGPEIAELRKIDENLMVPTAEPTPEHYHTSTPSVPMPPIYVHTPSTEGPTPPHFSNETPMPTPKGPSTPMPTPPGPSTPMPTPQHFHPKKVVQDSLAEVY